MPRREAHFPVPPFPPSSIERLLRTISTMKPSDEIWVFFGPDSLDIVMRHLCIDIPLTTAASHYGWRLT